MWQKCLFVGVCLFLIDDVFTFNLDSHNYAVYNWEQSTMFGFTVAVHKEHNRAWVLVGAPEAQSQFHRPEQVDRGGGVYKCRPDADNSCEEVPFDQEAYHRLGQAIADEKSHQWFGATLSTSGVPNGPVVACAPRYIWFSKDLKRRDPVGTCYVADGHFQSFEEYSPCRTMKWGYHRQGSCQAGFSAAINSIGDRLYVGSPGTYYWQGSVHQQGLEGRAAAISTREGSKDDDDSYIGYSTVVGRFQANAEYDGIVVGMPRGASLYGKVIFFTWDLNNYFNITCTSQIGSYFGYSLTAADLDGDGLLDLVVGAPLHTEPNTEGKYDVGRVYVFYQRDNFNTKHFIDGFNSKSRFGHALSSVGDLNQDGFDDFAVGAPYDGKNEQGAVYIYYGSADGVGEKYGQVIYGEGIVNGHPYGGTFGFSLAGGMDLDGNGYPDMAVGAYLSSSAYFFRSKPVVRVEAYVKYLTPNKQIDLNQFNCTLPSGKLATCTSVSFCARYSGKGIGNYIYLNFQYVLDTKKIGSPRMAFFDRGTHTFNETVTLQKDAPEICKTERIYIKNEIRDKLTALESELRYSLADQPIEQRRDPNSNLMPTLDLNLPPVRKDSITVQKNCGPDKTCIPNLHVDVKKSVEKYLIGSNRKLEFDVTVSNSGEDSFETTFEMKYPRGIFFNKIGSKSDETILCSPRENQTLKCDIGNPLPAGKIAQFSILLQPSYEDGMPQSYEFELSVNSTNPEDISTIGDNQKHVSIGIWIDSTIELSGVSNPAMIYFNSSYYSTDKIVKETDIGPQVIHAYSLRNSGPATVQEAEIFILWPYATFEDEDFLYLLEQPHTSGNVKCEPISSNYKNYMLEPSRLSIWERLKIDIDDHVNAERLNGVFVESGSGIRGELPTSKIHSNKKYDEQIGNSGDASLVHQDRQQSSSSSTFSSGSSSYQTGSRGGGSAVESQTYHRGGSSSSSGSRVPSGTASSSYGTRVSSGSGYSSYPENRGGSVTSGRTEYSSSTASRGGSSSSGTSAQNFGGRTGSSYSSGGRTSSGSSSSGSKINLSGFSDRFGVAGRQGQFFNSSGTVNSDGTTTTYTTERIQETENGVPVIRWRNTTTIRDSSGNIINSYHTVDDVYFKNKPIESSTLDAYGNIIRNQTRWYVESVNGIPVTRWKNSTIFENSQGKILDTIETYGITSGLDFNREQGGSETRESSSRGRGETDYSISSGGTTTYVQGKYPGNAASGHKTEAFNWEGSGRGRNYQSGGNAQSGAATYHQTSSGASAGSGYRQTSGESYYNRQSASSDGYYDAKGIFHAYNRTSSNYRPKVDKVEYSELNFNGQGGFSHQPAGFSVTTFDLGSNNGADLGANVQSSASGSNYQEQAQSGGQLNRQQSGTNRGRTEWHRESHWSQSGEIPPTYVNNLEPVGRDNVPTDRPNYSNHYRGKRQATRELDPSLVEIKNSVQCKATKCMYLKCMVKDLKRDNEVFIALRSRLKYKTLQGIISDDQKLKFSSMVLARISKLPFIGTPKDRTLYSHEVFTEVPEQNQPLKPKLVPLWVVILAAVAGTLILLLLIYLLYKLGFFIRNRPSSAPERQPLNRNGYNHGDEAL